MIIIFEFLKFGNINKKKKDKNEDSRWARIKKAKWYPTFKKVLIGVCSALVTSLILGACCFIYLVYNYKEPAIDVLFGNLSLEYSTIIYANGESGTPVEMEKLYSGDNRIWINYSKIPESVKSAVISIEDKRFYGHKGVDWKRTAGATLGYFVNRGGTFGGSTITQQLIKNITNDKSHSADRKIREIFRALYVERKYDKSEILEYYLNTVTFGNNCMGVETASNYYFNKSCANLSIPEVACLVGITNNPSLYDPFTKPEKNKARAKTILYEMFKNGYILTEEELNSYYSQVDTIVFCVENKEKKKVTFQSYFTDAVINDVLADLQAKKGYDLDTANKLLFTGGLRIYSTMDTQVQTVINNVYANDDNFPWYGKEMPQSALVVISPKNGDVVGMIGGRGEKTDNRGLNRATQTFRQPGSSIKPIGVYAPAIEYNIMSPITPIDNYPVTVYKGEPYPSNYEKYYSGLSTLRDAIEDSTNATAVRVITQLTPEKSYQFLVSKLGITSLVAQDKVEALALGGVTKGISPLEMTAAYQIFANNGIYNSPRTYSRVETSDGKILLEKAPSSVQAVSAQTAYGVGQFLETNMITGAGLVGRLSAGVPSGGKTGTTNDNFDRWFLGYSPDYVCGIWYGYDLPKSVGNISNPCTPLFKKVMDGINAAKGITGGSFNPPAGMTNVSYCVDSGEIPGEACMLDPRGGRTATAWVSAEDVPNVECTRHHKVAICTASGNLAHENCPEVTYVGLLDYLRQFPLWIETSDAAYMMPRVGNDFVLTVDPRVPAYASLIGQGYCPALPGTKGPYPNVVCTVHDPGASPHIHQ